MPRLLVVAACLLGGLSAFAQQAPSMQSLLAAAVPDDKPVIARAQSAAPEFAADALLIIAARAKPSVRNDMLAVAWNLAEKAPRSFPIKPLASDTSEGTIADRSDPTELDRLSLQARVVVALAERDPATARSRFEALSLAQLPPRYECDAVGVADPSPYYTAAMAVLGQLPDAASKRMFVARVAASARYPMQIAPLMRLMLDVPAAEQSRLSATLANVFDRVRGDDPAFAKSSDAILASFSLVLRSLPWGDRDTLALQKALRNYLLAHFQGSRCKANVEGEVFAHEAQQLLSHAQELGLSIEQIDDLHRADALLDAGVAQPTAAPLPGEEYYIEGWKLAQRILDAPDPAASQRENDQAVREFIAKLRDAGGSDNPAYDRYRSRVGALRRLADLLPDDGLKLATQQALFELLETSPLYSVDRTSWFRDASAVVAGTQDVGAGGADQLARKLASSSHPVFRLYGELALRERRPSPR